MKTRKSKKNPDLVVQCRKCWHHVFVTPPDILAKIPKLLESEEGCPSCWEEPYENWIIAGFGNFAKTARENPDIILE